MQPRHTQPLNPRRARATHRQIDTGVVAGVGAVAAAGADRRVRAPRTHPAIQAVPVAVAVAVAAAAGVVAAARVVQAQIDRPVMGLLLVVPLREGVVAAGVGAVAVSDTAPERRCMYDANVLL